MAIPSVSVICANFNYGRWVCGAVDSVAAQTYPAVRTVVVDDGSTDGSARKLAGCLRDRRPFVGKGAAAGVEGVDGFWRDTNLPVLVVAGTPARGPSAARNVALRCAWDGSDLFAVLDADDEMYPHKLTTLVAEWLADPNRTGIVSGDYDTVDPDGVLIREFKPPFSASRLRRECIVHSGFLASRRALEVVGGPDAYDEFLRCAEDWDVELRVLDAGYAFRHVPLSLTRVRTGSHNSTATVPSETWQRCWARVNEKAHERMNSGQIAWTKGVPR